MGVQTFYCKYPLRDGYCVEVPDADWQKISELSISEDFSPFPFLTDVQQRIVCFFVGCWKDNCKDLKNFLIRHNLAKAEECCFLTWEDILGRLYLFEGDEEIPHDIVLSYPEKTYNEYICQRGQNLTNIAPVSGGTTSQQAGRKQSKGKAGETKKDDDGNLLDIKSRFTIEESRILFDNKDLNLPTGRTIEIAKMLIENFNTVVKYKLLDNESSDKEATSELRAYISIFKKALRKTSCTIKTKKQTGYILIAK